MAMLSKDIVNMIYRLIHNDCMIILNKQYYDKFFVNEFQGQFTCLRTRASLQVPLNYRYLHENNTHIYKAIYRLTDKLALWEPVAKLPKHYFT